MSYNDIVVYGTVSSGTANSLAASSGTLEAGRYRATCVTLITGTAIASDRNNLNLLAGTNVIATVTQVPAVNTPYTNPPIAFTVPQASTVSLVSVGTVSASATYTPLLVITPDFLD